MFCTRCGEKIQGSTQDTVGWNCPFKSFPTLKFTKSCEVGLVCDLCITDEWSGKSIGLGGYQVAASKPLNLSEPDFLRLQMEMVPLASHRM